MSIDATVGGASANSYATLAEAQLYFDNRLDTDAWDLPDEDRQEAALIMACQRIEQESFTGSPVTSTQALQWPRYGVPKPNGWCYTSTEIPVALKRAQYELALALCKDSTLGGAGSDLDAFNNVQLGSMNVTPRHGASGQLPNMVRRMLAPLLAAGMSIPVVRA